MRTKNFIKLVLRVVIPKEILMRRLWKISKTKWYTKPAYLLVALAIVLSLGIVALPMAGMAEADPAEWYVDGVLGTNNATRGTGPGTDAFKTIQYAITDTRVSAGDTINVAAGTYNETAEVNKELTLQGEGRDVVTVTAANSDDHVFEVTANNVTISGFSITGAEKWGIYLNKSSGNTISDNEITDNVGHGIYLDSSSDNTISGNEITDNGGGINLDSSNNNQILENDVLNNSAPDSGIHLDSDSSGNAIHFNNIVGNSPYGVHNEAEEMVDAENNWWGDASGPTHASNLGGSGDTVSDNVDYDPWLGAELEEAQSEDVSGDGGTAEDSPTGGDVTVSGSAIPEGTTLTVAEYTSNPGGTPTFAATGDYYDVHLSDDEGVESLTIEFCPAEEDTVIYYWDGTSWRRATSQIYVGGCIVVYITGSTFPSLSDLTGRYFASGTPYPPPPVGGEAYPVDKLAILMPWIALFAAIVAAAETMLRRGRAQG